MSDIGLAGGVTSVSPGFSDLSSAQSDVGFTGSDQPTYYTGTNIRINPRPTVAPTPQFNILDFFKLEQYFSQIKKDKQNHYLHLIIDSDINFIPFELLNDGKDFVSTYKSARKGYSCDFHAHRAPIISWKYEKMNSFFQISS